MLKVKKIFSAFIGVAMTANTLMTMPFSAFADDEENSRTYVYDDYEISYDVTNSWENTEIVSVTLSNTSDSAIENWMLYFDPNGQVYNTVNVQEAQTSTGTTYYRNSGYNANVSPNSSVKRIESYAFNECIRLKNVTISKGVKEIGIQAFEGTALESVYIPSSVQSVGAYAFNKCKELKNVTISEGVMQFGMFAFAETALEKVIIPSSVQYISSFVFFNCDNLTEMTFKFNNPKYYMNDLFLECDNNIKLFIPSEAFDLYSNWIASNSNVTVYEINNEEG